MTTKMITCPHCGVVNSERKEKCYGCEQPLDTRKLVTKRSRVKNDKAARLPEDILPQPTQVLTRRPSILPGVIGVTLKQRVQFFRQFQHLLTAGISAGMSLSHLQNNVTPAMRPVVKDLAESVHAGGQLWLAMERYPSIFPQWEISMVRAAEKGGGLPAAMSGIADTLETEMEIRYQVGAKLLPLKATFLVFILTILIVAGVQTAVQGNVVSVLDKVFAAFSRLFQLLVSFLLLRTAWRYFARTRRGSRIAQAIVTRVPLIGPILKLQMQYRFVTMLSSLWKAGVSPMDALESAARASDNPLLMHRVADNLNRLTSGATLSDVLADTRMLPQEVLYMIKSGETSGTVGESLEHVAEYIRMELDAQVKSLPIRAQLAMYVIIGIPVAIFIISFWLRYYGPVLKALQ